MTAQLTPQQLEKIVDSLPISGNGDWSVRQKITSRHNADVTATIVTEVLILGPGDKPIGHWVSPKVYKPTTAVTYWYVRQMRDAGWTETEEMV
jgi:hypothetical protein